MVWIGADGTIARPNSAEVGTDMFADFTGVRPEAHMDQVRAWVRSDELPDDAGYAVDDLNENEISARLAFRLAVHHRRLGDESAASAWFTRAEELAPTDFTVRRAAMPLRGVDPFGDAFFDLFGAWQDAGSPYHGLPRS